MKLETLSHSLASRTWSGPFPKLDSEQTLVLAFGAPSAANHREVFALLRANYPKAILVGCSGAGEIAGNEVRDGSVVVSVVRFEKTTLRSMSVKVDDPKESRAAGQALADKLLAPDLRAVFVLSEGLKVNGSELVRGINERLPPGVVVTGGLAGDGTRFEKTWVAHNDQFGSGLIVAVGLYGQHLAVGHGSKGGWDKFGPERTITKSQGNVLYELDGKPALKLYKEYLGPKAAELPASGLLFPLALRANAKDDKVLVRTLLAVDEAAQSMTFAGDLPVGQLVQLMKADFERLINGAEGAANTAKSIAPDAGDAPTLAIAISCVGRRLVLGDRTEEEVEAVRDVLPKDSTITGFYSYGELSPYATGRCDLHNQTMTITTFAELAQPLQRDASETTDVRSNPAINAPPPGAPAGLESSTLSWSRATRKWSAPFPALDSPRTLVLAFGSPEIGEEREALTALAAAYPRSFVVGCSGAGQIVGTDVQDGVLSVAVARFGRTDLATATVDCPEGARSLEAGRTLGKQLNRPDLRAVFVLSEGLTVNGSDLVRGMNEVLDPSVVVTGGLAGDGTRFQKTWVLSGREVKSGVIVAVGLYGDHLVVGHGSQGGWDKFGPERTITKAAGNVLYELDGKPALKLYKEYLGPKAAELPASGLLFPLALRANAKDEKVLVRTLLAVDEAAQSMTFAGDLPVGHLVQLMKADFDRLIGGAEGAATKAKGVAPETAGSDTLAVAISCVGRRLVLGDRTEEEVEAVRDVLPKGASITGFYSYGELSPYATGRCDLHNQTMTLTTFAESLTPRARGTTPAAGKFEIANLVWEAGKQWNRPMPALDSPRTLVVAFGSPEIGDSPKALLELRKAFPTSIVVGCSGAGEIVGTEVKDGVVSVSVAKFAHTDLRSATVDIADASASAEAGRALGKQLARPDLKAVFVLSDGLGVNGSELVRGMNDVLDSSVVVTGGLAGDGTRFQKTWVLHGDVVKSGMIAAVGVYGDHVVIGHGSKGGWDKFGPERTVTRSKGNVLFELDGKPALALYKEYLGGKAAELPASGLLFPLSMRANAKDDKFLVRTLLAVDEAAQSMTFAGDLPEGHLVQLMKADFDRLIGGADGAATMAKSGAPEVAGSQTLAIAISCVGRRLVLGDRTEEEVEAVRDVLPKGASITGFYSYGELSPYATGRCDLHNQTMTLTTFAESPTPLTSKVASSAKMELKSLAWETGKGWNQPLPALDSARTLVVAFGSPEIGDSPAPLLELRKAFPSSIVLGCSGAGEIVGTEVKDGVVTVSVAKFANTDLRSATVDIADPSASAEAGRALGKLLSRPDLKAVFVLSDGLGVNGSELVRGMNDVLDASVVVTGGLAGDGTRFQKTWVLHGNIVKSGVIAAVGFYGEHVVIGHGSKGGWDKFGPERTVTRSNGNVLFEIDGKPALALYKEYLGAKASELPSSGLLFPLAMRTNTKDDKVLVRTLLAVDEGAQSMTFAGDVPQGHLVQLMKADFDRLVGGASGAATMANGLAQSVDSPTLAIAVSCVGRRLVLGDRTEEEVEAVLAVLPKGAQITGFYSYGELSPYATGRCDLHNQTMTLTTIAESPTPLRTRAERMSVHTLSYELKSKNWSAAFPAVDSPSTLVLAFGAPEIGDDPAPMKALAAAYPRSIVVGCSGAGEIVGTDVADGVLSVAVTQFAHTRLRVEKHVVADATQSNAAGHALGQALSDPELRAVFVLSEGLGVNGSELVRGFNDVLDPSVVVTGGLAGDGTRFQKTWVALGGSVESGVVVAVGLYGDHVVIGHGSKGGWDKFGPERTVTKSQGNVLFEIDGKPALALYKEYLGGKAAELPASGLLFPLAMRSGPNDDKVLVRTLLAVDEGAQSMTFAGDIPHGHLVQLMKADFDRLVGGASGAATMAKTLAPAVDSPTLAVAISCVGRRLVLGDRTEEEVEAVLAVLPKGSSITGFYSYGELSPYATGRCDLHNQTMTLTTIAESPTPIVRPRAQGAQNTVAAPAQPQKPVAREVEEQTGSAILQRPGRLHLAAFTYDLATKKWSVAVPPPLDSPRTLVLVFGASEFAENPDAVLALSRAYPTSQIVGCSGAGEIVGTDVRDGVLSVSVAKFQHTDLATATVEVNDAATSYDAGRKLARDLDAPDLRAVFVLSEGLKVNGSELVRGLNDVLDPSIPVTGGLAGDGTRFQKTWVAYNGVMKSGLVVAVGFYGDHVVVGHGSKGGWDKFGPERTVTKSTGNVLFEIDGKPALGLYKEYLGAKASELPASGLLFPLAMRSHVKDDKILVRTLLAVDEAAQSMTFAGDLPQGNLVQLMKADFDRLVGGASGAATMAKDLVPSVDSPTLAVAISCVGRRLVLGDRTEEEVEAVQNVLPKGAVVTGFYSYGELSPYAKGRCDLHNQTMTLTTIAESPVPLPRPKRTPTPLVASTSAPAPQPEPVRAAPVSSAAPVASPAASQRAKATPAPAPSRTPAPVQRSARPAAGAARGPRPTVLRAANEQRAAGGLDIQKRKIAGITSVSLSGRMMESFQGAQLGRELEGIVVFDLGHVDRITSFGVREWLAMLKETESRVERMYFTRCSEPVVNQITMIRGFSGRAKVLSFFAPYLCNKCGSGFSALIDAESDLEAIETMTPPRVSCPRCSADLSTFDDDPMSYFALGGYLASEVPEAVRRALAALDPVGAAEAIQKSIDGRVTRVKVNAALDNAIRWTKVLDGTEGQLVFDLGAVPSTTTEGASLFEAGLRSIAGDVELVRIEACPRMVLERLLGAKGLPKLDVASVLVEAHCAACAAARPAVVDLAAERANLLAGNDPSALCKRCNGALTFDQSRTLLRLAAQGDGPAAPAPVPAAAAPASAPAPVPVAPAPSGGIPMTTLALGGAVVALVAVIVMLGVVVTALVLKDNNPPPAPIPAVAAAPAVAPVGPAGANPSGWSQASDLPPAWVERPIVVEADQVLVVGKSAIATSEEDALAGARQQAMARLIGQIQVDLRGSPVQAFLAARVRTEPSADEAARMVDRYLAQVGSVATPERVDATIRPKPGGFEAFARYKLTRSTYDEVVKTYATTSDFGGMTVARFFPGLVGTVNSDAEIVVIAVDRPPASRAGVIVGDLVREVGGMAVGTVPEFADAASGGWDRTEPGNSLPLVLEANGAPRTVKLSKPKPKPVEAPTTP